MGVVKVDFVADGSSRAVKIEDATKGRIAQNETSPGGFSAPLSHYKTLSNIYYSKFAWLKLAGALTLANLCGLSQNAGAVEGQWVTTWGCAPQLTEPSNIPPAALAHNTLRQFVRTSAAGKFLRVRFSNAFGTDSVTLSSAHIALAAGTGSAGNGQIDPATDKALVFQGEPAVVIPAGAVVYSDSMEYDLPPLQRVALSIHFGDLSSTTISGHPGSRTTSFIKTGNTVADTDMAGATTTAHWYIITGIEILGDFSSRTVVTLGDSITDGRGSLTNGNTRWPDYLAQRLAANGPTATVGVANMGIGGGGIFGGLGPSAQKRFQRDVLNQSGARWVIIFIGVNDIGGADAGTGTTLAQNIITAFTNFASEAHAKNLLVAGATITPLGRGYYTADHESARQTINQWIRTTVVYDACLDFDAVVRDPSNPVNLLPAYSSDGLHMTPAGYEAVAKSINLTLFTQ